MEGVLQLEGVPQLGGIRYLTFDTRRDIILRNN